MSKNKQLLLAEIKTMDAEAIEKGKIKRSMLSYYKGLNQRTMKQLNEIWGWYYNLVENKI